MTGIDAGPDGLNEERPGHDAVGDDHRVTGRQPVNKCPDAGHEDDSGHGVDAGDEQSPEAQADAGGRRAHPDPELP
jgi:hypothetical protein